MLGAIQAPARPERIVFDRLDGAQREGERDHNPPWLFNTMVPNLHSHLSGAGGKDEVGQLSTLALILFSPFIEERAKSDVV